MVTPSSDHSVGVKCQIFNFVLFQWLRCQIVRLEPAIKSVNGDPVVRPLPWGQRSKERSNFQLCAISKVKVSNCSSRTKDQNCQWWPRRPTFPLGSNFQLCPISKIKVSNCSPRTKDLKCQWWPRRPTFPLWSNFQLCPISKIKMSNCSSRTKDHKCQWWPRCMTFPLGSTPQLNEVGGQFNRRLIRRRDYWFKNHLVIHYSMWV